MKLDAARNRNPMEGDGPTASEVALKSTVNAIISHFGMHFVYAMTQVVASVLKKKWKIHA